MQIKALLSHDCYDKSRIFVQKNTTQTMKKAILSATLTLLAVAQPTYAQQFEQHFCDSTLRLDYTFAGNCVGQNISLDQKLMHKGWYGRRTDLNKLPLKGNGQILMLNTAGTDTIYCHSFSTLFQEWVGTEEATRISRSFENSFLLPMPREKVQICITLYDTHQELKARLWHTIDPSDILIKKPAPLPDTKWSFLHKNRDERSAINVVFVPEGYTAEEMPVFVRDCQESVDAILEHEPFKSKKDRFNFIYVDAPSKQSGVSIPHDNDWRDTAVGSHFDTFYSARYLTTLNVNALYDLVWGIPCSSIIILANTDNYGGGGIYNSYTLTSAHNKEARPVVVHEFGHSFAGLADEYYYDDQYEPMYPSGVEPWEQNITTLVDFDTKWKDMLPSDTPIPTPADGNDIYTNDSIKREQRELVLSAERENCGMKSKVGVYEGAGYQSKGCYRPAQECRMKVNSAPGFCPVCQRAISRLIDFLAP